MRRSPTCLLIGKQLEYARKFANLSRKEMGVLTGYSEQTIANWEQGISSPKVVDFIQSYFNLNMNPDPFIKCILYPDIFTWNNIQNYDNSTIRKAAELSINGLPTIDIHGLHFVLFGSHGEDYRVYLNKYVANLHCPMLFRTNICGQIISHYNLCKYNNTLLVDESAKPDLNGLIRAYNSGVNAAKNKFMGYNVVLSSNENIGHYMLKARERAGKTQKEVYLAIGTTRNTIDKWESGSDKEIRISDFLDYFDALHINPEPYLKEIIDPTCTCDLDSEEDKRMRSNIIDFVANKMQVEDIHRLLYIMHGIHGSQTHYIIQEMYADIYCEISASKSATRAVISNYNICEQQGTLVNPEYAKPDLDILMNDLNPWDKMYMAV